MNNNIENLGLGKHDSFALWNVPNENLSQMSDKEREACFRENYMSEHFPVELLNENIKNTLENMKYVLIGLNPGNEGVSSNQEFLNFHGKKKSCDYRLAAALYDTEMWGAFMTDLVHDVESDSNQVMTDSDDVKALEIHLDSVGIPKEALLVALGNTSYQVLSKHATRKVVKLPHYSGVNGHWRAEKTREIVFDIIKHK